MKNLVLLVAAGCALVVVFCVDAEGGFYLVFGWIPFLYRVLSRVTVNWISVGAGCAAFVLFTIGLHVTTRVWQRTASGDTTMRPWKFRWSLVTVVSIVLLFTAGTAIVGIAHQTAWILNTPEPMRVPVLQRFGDISTNNLKMMLLGVHDHADSGGDFAGGSFTREGEMLHSWETALMSYSLYSTSGIDFKLPWNDPKNERYFKCVVSLFINPEMRGAPLEDANGYGLSHYSANSRVLSANQKVWGSFPGSSNLILIGEINTAFKPWGHPVNWRDPALGINKSPRGFGGPRYGDGANFAMADGSVRFLSERTSPEVLHALATPGAGDQAGEVGW